MAGVGPFAMPAARNRGCYVLANDLNPASFESLERNTLKNRVQDRCETSCVDGRRFIRDAIRRVWEQPVRVDGSLPPSANQKRKEERHVAGAAAGKKAQDPSLTTTLQPQQEKNEAQPEPRRLIDHFVMNLPGSALEFLDAYRGAYRAIVEAPGGAEELQREQERVERDAAEKKNKGEKEDAGQGEVWPMVHVHCFTKDLEHPRENIIARANAALGLTGHPAALQVPPEVPVREVALPQSSGAGRKDEVKKGQEGWPDVSLHFVRAVAPNKDMYCLSFRLSRAILVDLEPIAL